MKVENELKEASCKGSLLHKKCNVDNKNVTKKSCGFKVLLDENTKYAFPKSRYNLFMKDFKNIQTPQEDSSGGKRWPL